MSPLSRRTVILLITLIILLPVNFGIGFFAGYKIALNKSQSVSPGELQNLGPYYLPKEAIVVNVIDGDTIEISPPNQIPQITPIPLISPIVSLFDRLSTRSIRYLGIDAPNPGEDNFQEAKIYNERLVLGKKVTLEYDTPQNDKYGRILAWVWLNDKLINKEMLASGLAKPLTMENQKLKYDLMK